MGCTDLPCLPVQLERDISVNTHKNLQRLVTVAPDPGDASAPTLREAREELERIMVERSLRKHDWKISLAAAELGISRPTFYQLLKKLGVTRYPG